ncbi:MAG TPA: carboxypeptidase-like regulatory domain-containing protein [Acidobacteriota bacterium]
MKLRFLLLLLLVTPSISLAQTATATLLGTVTDPQSAAVPGAHITVAHSETAASRSVMSDEGGNYEIPALAIGPYTLRVEMPGFTPETYQVVLRVGQRTRLDVKLRVGEVAQTVNVEAESASLLNTEQSVVGQVVQNEAIVNMPLNGRNFYQLAALTPGAIFLPAGPSTRSNFVSVYLGGTRARKTAFYLDGIDITETQFGGTYLSPSVDAVQEFKVQTANIPAEYGRSGGNILTTIKSGTNSFHGTAFEFVRDDSWAARNFFAQNKGELTRHQFGGTLGGPIVRDRTFFFANMEGTRQHRADTRNLRAPTEEMKRGVFPFRINDPENNRAAFPNNTIPSGRMSTPALYFLRFIPTANSVDSSGRPAFVFNPVQRVWQNNYNLRSDTNFNSRNMLFARYSHMDLRQTDPTDSPLLGDYPPLRVRAQNAALGYTRILGSGTLNEFRVGYNRSHLFFRPVGEGTDHTAAAGIRGFANTAGAYPAFPDVLIESGYVQLLGLAQDQRPKRNRIDHWQVNDNFTVIRGSHSMKTGFEWRHQKATFVVGNRAQGEFFFNGNFTGDAFADFLLGAIRRVRRAYPLDLFGVYDDFWGIYFQDDWKTTRNLTLNLGLRWEQNPFYKGIRNQMSAFDFSNGHIIVASQNGNVDLAAQQVSRIIYPRYADIIETSEQRRLPVSVRPPDRNDWSPRLGLAWRPFGADSMVIRAAYGIFFEFADTNFPNSYAKVPPFVWNEDESLPTGGRITRTFADPFGGSEAAIGGGFPTLLTSQVNLRNSYAQQWNFSIQRALPWNMAAEVGYIGQKGTRLEINQNFNDCPASTTACAQARRPYPRFGASARGDFDAHSVYHAFQTKLEKRLSAGLSFLASYVWSKSIDNASNALGGSPNQYDLRNNRGLSDNDIPHRFVGSWTWQLPVARNASSQLLRTVAGGWEASGILTLQSGLPFTVSINSDRANTGRSGGQRPNVREVPNEFTGHRLDQWFDTRPYTLPATGTFGALGRNTLRSDSTQSLDLALLKNFQISERYFQFRAEFFNLANHPTFGAPVAVIPSEVPLDAPIGDPRRTPSRFGTVNTASDPRIIQLGFKFVF